MNVESPYSYIFEDCRLYEFDINLNNSDDLLPINKYIVRGTSNTKDYQASNNATIIRKDNSLVFVYNMDTDDYKGDSWIVIENLDRDFNTLSTMYYSTDHDGLCHEANSVIYTKDDGILLVGRIYDITTTEITDVFATKFPASAFNPDNIEEAHAHGLHLAVAYPNPGGDVLNIRCGLRNAILQVYDINGRKIHEEEITDDVTSIDASGWQSGTYIWKLGMRNEELGMKEVESGKWIK
jgi:hypothetical protein